MQLHFSTLPQTELDRRLANLDRYMAEAKSAALEEIRRRADPFRDAMDTPEGVSEKALSDLVAAADVAERVYRDKVRAEAISDLLEAAQLVPRLTAAPEVKLFAKPTSRPTMRPCFTVTTEEGEVLIFDTDHPLADGAAALLTRHNLPEETLIALYHEGRGYPSFGPMKLGAAASCGLLRQSRRGDRARADKHPKGAK